jgi:hypothetical protein
MIKNYLRPGLSTALVFFFFLVLLFLGLFAEVFESRSPEVDLAQIYANPIAVDELQRLKNLRLTNRHGNFLFENTHPQGHIIGPWQMVEPQHLRVKGDVVAKILETLSQIRVRNFHRLEPINVTSFSLDNPTLKLFFNTWKNKSYEIKMGLINPIDNSAYLSLSGQDQIYQIDPLEMALESYDLSQLVESKILALNIDSLASLELYEGNTQLIKLFKKDNHWFADGLELAETKVVKFFERLEEIKSSSILDDLTTEQRDFLDKVLSTSSYTLKIISNQGVRNYFFGELKADITLLPGLPKEAAGQFVMSSEDRQSFVLIDREQLRIFQTRSKDLN